ncbi:MAG: SDR family oxidoreductase [Pseudomonadota bacterium]|mgnify:FL=1|jgi:NAD(P)-dependent dehydrogenase (short-subunit alcohol dehydrogenase family)|nr:SDR family oxidoreductase [Pseudomonadota bacterium]MEC8233632.1 SDR family oxidoreductase [Pseudomonadota bacterium]MEC8752297.1 SDR family oxidoreductase [Pseudomonadota bacterium]MEE3007608.1 SDR family oxidoreductase [Pseudomonadota bacterium]|tara:strand:+ start:467 stop:1141 length:675 start_codon:yes stop_codon:yes gene_type:complete
MTTIMITGASRGLGLEFARQFYSEECRVIATCRNPKKANELNSIGDIDVHSLDVTDDKSVANLADKLRGENIDILINNAGVIGQRDGFGRLDYDIWAETMDTNVFGPMRVAEAFRDNVMNSEKKQMIFITSRMGSITEAVPNAYVYRSSKAALNMAVKCLSVELEQQGLIAVLFHPGHVQTDMGGQAAPVTPQKSIEGMKNQIVALTHDDNGRFLSYDGHQIPW